MRTFLVKITATLLLLFTGSTLLAQSEMECSAFTKGKFTMESEGIGTIIIKRGKKYQYETQKVDGKKLVSKFSIIWTGPCSYDLVIIKSDKKIPPILKNKILHVEINGVEENTYTYKSWIDEIDMTVEGSITKIK